MTSCKLILFDLGNVILPFNLRYASRKFEKESHLSSEEIIHAVMGTSLDHDFEKGKISPQAFYEAFKERVGLRMSYETFVSFWNDIFSEDKTVSALVRNLKKHYPVAIISNTNILHFEHTRERFPIVREIGEFILSYEVGARKPDPQIFQAALERFKVCAEETLYIDDRKDFILESQRLGFMGIHFEGSPALQETLKGLGVLRG